MDVHGFTVYDMIARGAALYGDAPAVIQGELVVSFREFRRRVDALAGGLAALGIGPGDRVCVLAQNDVAYLDLYGACARQGILAYPINWRLSAEEVERVVERAAPTMLLADASTLGVVGEWPGRKAAVAHWYQFGEFAAPGSSQAAVKGVGLSLAVCRSIVSEYGGSIEVSPAPEGGTSFRVVLPAAFPGDSTGGL